MFYKVRTMPAEVDVCLSDTSVSFTSTHLQSSGAITENCSIAASFNQMHFDLHVHTGKKAKKPVFVEKHRLRNIQFSLCSSTTVST